MGISVKVSRTSIFVTTTESRALIIAAYLAAGPSNQPHRRGRPVVDPYSFPRVRICSPAASSDSVGNGPAPTLVVYAFEIPMTLWTCLGETPRPVETPPAAALEEVTKGNVP